MDKSSSNCFRYDFTAIGNQLSITKQSLQSIERREIEGSITLKTLRDVANGMDMELVYGFVPKDGSLKFGDTRYWYTREGGGINVHGFSNL